MQHNTTDASQYKQPNTHSKTCTLTSYIYYILSVFKLKHTLMSYIYIANWNYVSAVCLSINKKESCSHNTMIKWTCILCGISTLYLILQMCCSLRNTQSPEGLLCLKQMDMHHLYSYQSHTVLIKIQTATSEKLLFEEGNLPHNVTVLSVTMQ